MVEPVRSDVRQGDRETTHSSSIIFAAVHASIHNHFNLDRQLNRRGIFKQNRAAVLAEWRHLAA
jgi:putative transposase